MKKSYEIMTISINFCLNFIFSNKIFLKCLQLKDFPPIIPLNFFNSIYDHYLI